MRDILDIEDEKPSSIPNHQKYEIPKFLKDMGYIKVEPVLFTCEPFQEEKIKTTNIKNNIDAIFYNNIWNEATLENLLRENKKNTK